jgi:hypothetical protein
VRESDVGNYTCVAENVVNRRLSPPAKIDIFGKTKIKLCTLSYTYKDELLYSFNFLSNKIEALHYFAK